MVKSVWVFKTQLEDYFKKCKDNNKNAQFQLT